MINHSKRRLIASFLGAFGLVMVLVTGFIVLANPGLQYRGWGFRGFPAAIALPILLVGLLIVLRNSSQKVGWFLVLLGLASAWQGLLFEFGLLALSMKPEPLPAGTPVAWILNWYWIVIIWLASMILVLMPDGRLPSPRWRVFVLLLGGLALMGITLTMLNPGPLSSSFPSVINPTGLKQLTSVSTFLSRGFATLYIITSMGGGAVALISRYRQSQGVQRQQLKWLAFAAFVIGITAPIAVITGDIGEILFILAISLLPLAIGIAILRYRLYDIDIIIRRTLVYGLLSLVLVGVYFGSVVLLQETIRAISGNQSPAAIVISTLIIAALFNPLRQRVQAFIDRRFFRQKYDAQQVLAQFTQAARDEVSMETLAAELSRVVQETMQPEMTVLWFSKMERFNSHE